MRDASSAVMKRVRLIDANARALTLNNSHLLHTSMKTRFFFSRCLIECLIAELDNIEVKKPSGKIYFL